MRPTVPKMALVAAALALGACQTPDVGQPCTLSWGTGETATKAPDPVQLYNDQGSDWFESGNTECENLVCIVSPAAPGTRYASDVAGRGYCSKPCVSDQDCFESKTGLVCRQMVLDPGFISALRNSDPALADRYLGETQFSSYCAVQK